jgi:hypothetical protein
MNAPAPATELVDALTRAAAALDAGDPEAAGVDMAAAADLCRRLQTAGLSIPAPELTVLRELYERCGVAVVRMGQELNAAGFRGEQQRRGMEAYLSTATRGR